MRILFLHGWQSVPGGVKPTFLKDHGHEVINPALPDDDFALAVRIAQAEFDTHQPQVVGSVVALHPENDPWHRKWKLGVGDVLNATVVRWVENADRCGGKGGYLLALRPAAFVMLCGQEAGRFKNGDSVAVKVTALDARTRQVTVGLMQ